MGGVPSKPGDPSGSLEVIGAGFSRTGTVSMQIALEELLGDPVMHGETHILFREHGFGKKWTQVYEARGAGEKARTLKLLRELVAGFAGVTALPAVDFVPELLELYPDAKAVLVTRSRDRWWESFGKVLSMAQLRFMSVFAAPMPGLRYRGASRPMEEEGLRMPLGPELVELVELIELHNIRIKSFVPPDQLLVMSVKEYWGPLARIWGRTTRTKPFPRAKEAEAAETVANENIVRCLLV